MPTKPDVELVKFKAPPAIRRALKLRAALEDVDMTDIIIEALTITLEPELKELHQRGLIDEVPRPKERKRPAKRKE